MTTYDEIAEAINALEDLKKDYLLEHGWTQTCNTPGSYWLWKRDFSDVDEKSYHWWQTTSERVMKEGRDPPSRPVPMGIVMADMDLAVRMTESVLETKPEEQD